MPLLFTGIKYQSADCCVSEVMLKSLNVCLEF